MHVCSSGVFFFFLSGGGGGGEEGVCLCQSILLTSFALLAAL